MISFVLNGQPVSVQAGGLSRLIDVLRHELGLTGTKEGCGEGECGACSVLVDGQVVNSCLLPVCQVDGSTVQTIEGIGGDDLDLLQRAFMEHGGTQCGMCTPGMIVAAKALIDAGGAPSLDDVREGLAGNLCRCTGYAKILDAVLAAAAARREEAT
ncbi:MAG: (2Fe-2S)-binding protein [Deltaproteobacteria bacterium]|nr:(2Fe-2S)-binding protein [Deltaproteobacteria bacterium]